jgi:hypothetical protein
MNIENTLEAREIRYGSFESLSNIAQTFKQAIKNTENYHKLDDDMKESLDMIAHKIARILNGDCYYIDSWHDISGYATLVETRLRNM